MKSDYRRAQFEPKPLERSSRAELAAVREWARKHPCDFAFVRRSKRMVANLKAAQ